MEDVLLAGRGDAGQAGKREVTLVDQLLGRGDREIVRGGELAVLERGLAQLGACVFLTHLAILPSLPT